MKNIGNNRGLLKINSTKVGFYFFKIYFIFYAVTVGHFFPLSFITLCPVSPTLPSAFSHLSSCPWVVHISSLASPFPILFLIFPCLFCTYHLCFLFPVPFPPLSPTTLITFHVISISVNVFLFYLFA